MSVRLARRLLRHRKRWLEKRVIGVPDYAYRQSRELDRIILALEALG